jgi:hypothetical protein
MKSEQRAGAAPAILADALGYGAAHWAIPGSALATGIAERLTHGIIVLHAL